MADRPIIFSGPMVRAMIEGRKTQTRRIIKSQPGSGAKGCYHRPSGLWVWVSAPRLDNGVGFDGVGLTDPFRLPYAPGDRLWAREAFTMNPAVRHPDRVKNVIYRADVPATEPPASDVLTMDRLMWAGAQELKWKPSIHMPRWASRLTLTVTDVRVQRLRDISEADAQAEGARLAAMCGGHDQGMCACDVIPARDLFQTLWDSLHGPDAWDANPWVVALTFTVERRNIDAAANCGGL